MNSQPYQISHGRAGALISPGNWDGGIWTILGTSGTLNIQPTEDHLEKSVPAISKNSSEESLPRWNESPPFHPPLTSSLYWYIRERSQQDPRGQLQSQSQKSLRGFPGGREFASQCRWHGFDPWSGRVPHGKEQLSQCLPTTKPVLHERPLK